MSTLQLSPPRLRSRWRRTLYAPALSVLCIALFAWWQLSVNDITVNSIFPLKLSGTNELEVNGIAGGSNANSFWVFSKPKGDFLFALGSEMGDAPGRNSIYPGWQAMFSDSLLTPSFKWKHGPNYLTVRYDDGSKSIDIDGKTYEIARGNVLFLRKDSEQVEQYAVTVDEQQFQKPFGCNYLLQEIDKAMPAGK